MKKTASMLMLAVALTAGGCSVFRGSGKKVTPTLGERIPILGIQRDNTADPALAGVPVVLPAPVVNPNWSQPGGNAAKDIGHVALPAALSQAWTAQIAGSSSRARLAASPVIENGRLYATDTAARVHAFDAKTGARIWTVETDTQHRNVLFGGGVSVEGDVVYATNGFGDVLALRASDGAKIWSVHPAGPLRGSPTIFNGNIFVMSQDNELFALDARDGSVQWQKSGTLGQASIFGVAAPAAGQGTVIAGYSTGELSAYRYENGRELWSDALSRTSISTSVSALTDIDADPVVDSGRVYAVGQGGRMAAYELVSGTRIWELNIASIATPSVAGDWLFVLTDDAKLLTVQRTTGKIRSITQLQHYRGDKASKGTLTWRGPVLAGGRLIVASSDGQVKLVSPTDGSVAPMVQLRAGVSLSPVVADNMLYILDDSGRITAWR